MKILLVGPHESPIIQRLLLKLRERNHTVWLASFNAEDSLDIINLGRLKGIFDFFKVYKINHLVKKLKPDVVHAHIVSHYGIMALCQRKPLVVALWGSEVMLDPNVGSMIKKCIFRIINYLVLCRADLCHTSAEHVAIEAEKQYRGAFLKTRVFYWGLPLDRPTDRQYKELTTSLSLEFGLKKNEKYVVFPRGLDEVYSPKIVVKIINKLKLKINNTKQIVVLKGFCSEIKELDFKNLIDVSEITYINRVLSSEELYYLYENTFIHVSIPESDSLGGGVIEPSTLGSFPILSNLPSYKTYALKNDAYVMESFTDYEIEKVAEIILRKLSISEKKIVSQNQSAGVIIEKIEETYQEVIKNKNYKWI